MSLMPILNARPCTFYIICHPFSMSVVYSTYNSESSSPIPAFFQNFSSYWWYVFRTRFPIPARSPAHRSHSVSRKSFLDRYRKIRAAGVTLSTQLLGVAWTLAFWEAIMALGMPRSWSETFSLKLPSLNPHCQHPNLYSLSQRFPWLPCDTAKFQGPSQLKPPQGV